jgi:hypothetical protein
MPPVLFPRSPRTPPKPRPAVLIGLTPRRLPWKLVQPGCTIETLPVPANDLARAQTRNAIRSSCTLSAQTRACPSGRPSSPRAFVYQRIPQPCHLFAIALALSSATIFALYSLSVKRKICALCHDLDEKRPPTEGWLRDAYGLGHVKHNRGESETTYAYRALNFRFGSMLPTRGCWFVRGDDDFSPNMSLLHIAHGFADLAQRLGSVDDRCELPCFEELLQDSHVFCLLESERFRSPSIASPIAGAVARVVLIITSPSSL